MTPLELKTIKDGALLAKFIVHKVKPRLDALNIDFDAAGGVKDTVDQAALDGDASLSGLLEAQLDDGMYALTSVLKTAIDGSYSQLEKLASRADPANSILTNF